MVFTMDVALTILVHVFAVDLVQNVKAGADFSNLALDFLHFPVHD